MNGDLSLAVQYIAWALYVVIFTSVSIRFVRLPTRAHADMTVFFGLTGLLSIVGGVVAALGLETAPWLNELNSVLLLCLPYLLLRLVGDFADLPAHLLRWAEVGLGLALAAVLLLPRQLPGAITMGLIIYFFGLLSFDTLSFFRAARRARGVTRRRLLAIGAGSIALGAAILIGVLASTIAPLASFGPLGSRLAALFSAAAYWVGFAPPVWLRKVWQEPALRDFLDLSRRLTSEPEMRVVVRELEDAAAQTIGVSATVGLWMEAEGTLRFFARGARPGSSSTGQDVRFAEDADGGYFDVRPGAMLAGRAFDRQELVFATDVQKEDPTYAPYYAAVGSQALMAAPISARQRRLGVLVAYAHRAPMFAQSDLEILQLLANHIAVILDNRLLIEETVDARAQEEANRLRDELLAVISHDLRNPLAAMRGTGQVLERRLARAGEIDRERLVAVLRIIDASTNQMSQLIDQLVDYARLQAAQPLDLDRQTTDLVSLARRVIEPFSSASEIHKVHVATAADSLTGVWDTSRLERALQNLLTNALKYSPYGGEIVVRVDRQNVNGCQWALLEVEDHGLGIPADEVAGIFERFRRARNVTGRIPGTGIGLATARQIVEQHGGTIEVQSTEGRGTTFTIRLPVSGEHSPSVDGWSPPPRHMRDDQELANPELPATVVETRLDREFRARESADDA